MKETPEFVWRPFDPKVLENPYPMYAWLRNNAPVFLSSSGEWVITRYQDIKAILKDTRFKTGHRVEWLKKASVKAKEQGSSFDTLVEALSVFLVFKNPPEHTQIRKLVSQAWSDRSVDSLIKDNVQFIFKNTDWHNCDFAKDVAEQLPTLTMAGILGLPLSDRQYLSDMSRDMSKSMDMYLRLSDLTVLQDTVSRMVTYFTEHIEHKKKNPDESLMSKLVVVNNNVLSIHELCSLCIFLLISGKETTASTISLGMMNLLQHNKIDDMKSAEGGVDELLRYDAPVQVAWRTCMEETEINGYVFPAGSRLILCLGSANRDEVEFENPDELNFHRRNHHVAFGSGIHYCMGDWLAKAEATIVFRELFNNFKTFELTGKPVYRENLILRILLSLPLKAQ